MIGVLKLDIDSLMAAIGKAVFCAAFTFTLLLLLSLISDVIEGAFA